MLCLFFLNSALILKLPLYNKIRQLKRKLTQMQSKQLKLVRRLKSSTLKRKTKGAAPNTKPDEDHLQDQCEEYEMPSKPDDTSEPADTSAPADTSEPVDTSETEVGQGEHETNEVHKPDCTALNPKESAIKLLEESGVSAKKHPKIVKEITAFQTLTQQVSAAPKKMKLELFKKHNTTDSNRCASYLGAKLGVHRRSIFSPRKTSAAYGKRFAAKQAKVREFLQQPENSTMLPGKHDALTHGNHKYTLNDTLANLYNRFTVENPACNMSRSTFAKLRPRWMKPIQYASRRQCLCSRHQNFSLKLKAIGRMSSPNTFIIAHDDSAIVAMLDDLPDEDIHYKEWQRVDITYQNKIIKKMRLADVQVHKQEFKEIFLNESKEFRQHVQRATTQYIEINNLKQNLEPMCEITIQMDYSENYVCSYQDEPSQIYYDRNQVSLHPMIVHYRDQTGTLQHITFVGISDEKSHSAITTFTFIQKLIPKVQDDLPSLKYVHFITDSPASQYRNRTIAKLIANFPAFFPGLKASWEYLEAGHGKGPCDGIGGSVKKSADIAIKKGCVIANASEFYMWAQENLGHIKSVFITPEEIQQSERKLRNPIAIKGLSLIHTLRPYENAIWMRECSCYKQCCQSVPTCSGWIKTDVSVNDKISEETSQVNNAENVILTRNATTISADAPVTEAGPRYSIHDFVEARYGKRLYIGQVQEYAPDTNDYYISFMRKGRNGQYIWPPRKDEVWVIESAITRVVKMTDGHLVE